MNVKRHGLSIGIERNEEEFYLSITATGKLTHDDYQIITPLIDSALAKVSEPRVNVFLDVTDFEGWELRAAWDDFKLGLKHGSEFKRVAIYGKPGWQELMARVGEWFISGDIEFFDDPEQALSWLNSKE